MKIYLAGPMRGLPYFNHTTFNEYAAALRKLGHEVFNPVESTENLYGAGIYARHPKGDEPEAGIDGRKVFFLDLEFICKHAEAIAMLPGWENSKGARAEHAVAIALGHKILYLA